MPRGRQSSRQLGRFLDEAGNFRAQMLDAGFALQQRLQLGPQIVGKRQHVRNGRAVFALKLGNGGQASLDVVTEIRDTLVGLMKKGKGAQNMIDEKALAAFEGRLSGDPARFIFTAYRGLWAHVRELGGIV